MIKIIYLLRVETKIWTGLIKAVLEEYKACEISIVNN